MKDVLKYREEKAENLGLYKALSKVIPWRQA